MWEIDYLADHMDLAPVLAEWHYQEWAALLPDWTFEEALTELRGHTGRRQIPTTLVAWEAGRPLGSASLVARDPPGWEHLTPWVASVYVVPEARGRGVGRALVSRGVREAAALAISVVYLFTAGQAGYYQNLGWEVWQPTRHEGREAAILRYHIR